MDAWQRPIRRESHPPLQQPRDPRGGDEGVVEPGDARRPLHRPPRVGDQSRPQRDTVGVDPVLLPFALEPRHVDVRRALALAALAGEAQIHHLGQLGRRPGIGPRAPHRRGERLAENIGPGPGRVLLVARRHVAGAHRSPHLGRLAALADAATLLRRPQHPLHGVEIEHCLVDRLRLPRHDPQLRVHREGVDDLAGIENPLRIEQPLHADEMLEAGVPDHRADELAAEPSVAMLAT